MARRLTVELYGIARLRAGTGEIELRLDDEPACLKNVLEALARAAPQLVPECLGDGRLASGYVASLDAKEFVSDPNVSIGDSRNILILSADAGG